MNFEQFKKVIDSVITYERYLERLSELGIDTLGSYYIEHSGIILDILIDTNFTTEGKDWIYWWLYEQHSSNFTLSAYNEDDTEIPMNTIEDLWNYVKKYLKNND